MWTVKIEKDAQAVNTAITFAPDEFGKGLPKGLVGQTEKGYCFYSLKKAVSAGCIEDFITCDIVKEPVLKAVTEDQFNNWQKKVIVAKPAIFIWK